MLIPLLSLWQRAEPPTRYTGGGLPKGAVIIAAPLKSKHGTGSPLRVLALVGR